MLYMICTYIGRTFFREFPEHHLYGLLRNSDVYKAKELFTGSLLCKQGEKVLMKKKTYNSLDILIHFNKTKTLKDIKFQSVKGNFINFI